MHEKNEYINIVSDIEMCLRKLNVSAAKIDEGLPYEFEEFEELFEGLNKDDADKLKEFILGLLEKRGPKRPSGKIDTVRFYEMCSISPTAWSNFMHGKYSEATIRKIIAGLECNMEDTKKALELAGFALTNSRLDRLLKAAIMSGHHNSQDMYTILNFYSRQYPNDVKNYYKE